ncbi:MAG: hypothetical protein PUB86_04780 [Elusimicrobia bacterium]|nr:hypothetical protein [Elusimicrobiota bacterium]
MSKKKTVRKVFFAVFCFFACAIIAHAESCSSKGQVQYKPNGSCGTSQRTCCATTSAWSDWDKDCPQCSESATSWASSGEATDTCPGGDSVKEYQCDGSFVGTCTDIKAEPNDKDMGATSTFSFDPPSGYIRSYACYDSDRKQNKKIAISYDQELQLPTYTFAYAYCRKEEVYDDLTGKEGVKYIFSFYPKSGGYYTNEQIPECPEGVDGNYYGCNTLCNVPSGDNHGCKKEAKCYKLGGFLSEANCETWPVGETTGSIHTCGVGAGGVKFKYNLKQCGFKYQKRTVTCCAK